MSELYLIPTFNSGTLLRQKLLLRSFDRSDHTFDFALSDSAGRGCDDMTGKAPRHALSDQTRHQPAMGLAGAAETLRHGVKEKLRHGSANALPRRSFLSLGIT